MDRAANRPVLGSSVKTDFRRARQAMKTAKNLGLKIGTGCLFLAFSALTSFASCGAQSQHAGYQGIPRLDSCATVEAVETVGSSGAYSGLPHRLDQAETFAAQPALHSDEDSTPVARSNAGYSGLPHSSLEVRTSDKQNVPVEAAGYRGIPIRTDHVNDDFPRTEAVLVRPK